MSTKRFPRARIVRQYKVRASHALPSAYAAAADDVHEHEYMIAVVYHHERNGPWTWDRAELDHRFLPILDRVAGKNMNEVCGEPASDEVLASWLLRQSPGWVEEVQVYRETPDERGFDCRTTVRRRDLE